MGNMEVVFMKTTYSFPEPSNPTWIGSKEPSYHEPFGIMEEIQIFFYCGEVHEISFGFDIVNHVGIKSPSQMVFSPITELQIYERLIGLALSEHSSPFPFSIKKAN